MGIDKNCYWDADWCLGLWWACAVVQRRIRQIQGPDCVRL